MPDTKPLPPLLLTAYAQIGVPQAWFNAPTTGAAQRIADAVNAAWDSAWAAESKRTTGLTSEALQKALAIKTDPDLLERLELAARKPEEMERSGWVDIGPLENDSQRFIAQDFDPVRPGVYEVQWDDEWSDLLFSEWVGVNADFPYGWRAGSRRDSWPDSARYQEPSTYRPLRWRGITQAQARALGVV